VKTRIDIAAWIACVIAVAALFSSMTLVVAATISAALLFMWSAFLTYGCCGRTDCECETR
jgi:hypothetical protein